MQEKWMEVEEEEKEKMQDEKKRTARENDETK